MKVILECVSGCVSNHCCLFVVVLQVCVDCASVAKLCVTLQSLSLVPAVPGMGQKSQRAPALFSF